jgi:hypothetical protein
LTNPALALASCSSPSETSIQSRTPPFQSAMRPSWTRTVTTRTVSPILGHSPAPLSRRDCPKGSPSSSEADAKVLFSRCRSLHHRSSSEPHSTNRAVLVMVVEMLESALVLRVSSRFAREDRVAAGGGDPSRVPAGLGARVGGRWETQSCTRRDTRGLTRRCVILRDAGLVVMIMVGCGSKGVEGR